MQQRKIYNLHKNFYNIKTIDSCVATGYQATAIVNVLKDCKLIPTKAAVTTNKPSDEKTFIMKKFLFLDFCSCSMLKELV